jgi:pimeloyl-ACP methyl ester carboxylesterase
VRDALADYIRKNNLDKPVVVGYSLGGYLVLLAVKYPDLPGKLVIVDSYPYLAGTMNPDLSPAEMKQALAATPSTSVRRTRTCTSAWRSPACRPDRWSPRTRTSTA